MGGNIDLDTSKLKVAFLADCGLNKVEQSSIRAGFVLPHLVPPEVVDDYHSGQVQHHAQTLEGGHGEPQRSILLDQAGGVVPAVGAALAARQALIGHVGGLVSARALLLT